MGFNIGAFAGGAAQGIKEGLDNESKRKAQERQDKEWAKQDEMDKELAVLEEARKARFDESAQRKKFDADQSSTRVSTQIVNNPAANGIVASPLLDAPKSDAEIVKSAQGNGIAAARGIQPQDQSQPSQPFTAEKPTFVDDMEHLSARLSIKAKYGKADEGSLLQMHQAIKTLKNDGVDDAVAKIHHGDIAGAMKEFNDVGQYRGAKVIGQPQAGEYDYAGVKLPTTIVTIEMPDGAQQTINTAQYGAARFKMDQTLKAIMKGAEIKQAGKHQDETLNETKRHNIASEGIARAGGGSEGTTAEIKNARVFFPELYKENPAKALSAFKDLTTGEMTAAKVRQTLMTTYSDSMKGGWPDEAGTTQKERDAFVNKRVEFVMGKSDSSVAQNPGAQGDRPSMSATIPPTNSRGWKLHTDANGNRAYVSPDRKQFEEVK